MSNTASRKTLESIALAFRIERSSAAIEMAPCSFCRRHGRRCIAVEPQASDDVKSSRCSECVRHRRPKCDYTSKLPSLRDWESIDRQRQKLKAEEEEAMAKILRLRKQQRFLDDREQEMLRRGLSTLEELDQAEASEKVETERLEAQALALTEASAFLSNPSLDPEALTDLPESFWANLGFPGNSHPTPSGLSASSVLGRDVSSGTSLEDPDS
jgi:hypothetical protein